MKAFQLKIQIKNSKPPIWRRVIIPAGITFSQLSMILNEVMGWDGYHTFEFEFYHMELRLAEGAEEIQLGYGPYDYIEASTTFIREYLEENDWFTYTYDLGDEWQHRVTIEKIIEDYEYDYPQVMKYKGECPIEDCGGIYGYYDNLDIINDTVHPEYEERLEWMKSQGYPKTYDMDAVNNIMKKQFFYKWGKGEKRPQHKIYEDHFSQKFGLKATRQDENEAVYINMSGKHKFEESMKQFREAFEEMMWREERLTETTLADIFEDYPKGALWEMADRKAVNKGSKTAVIKNLIIHMLQPDVARRYFLCLTDEEIEEFEKASKACGEYIPEDEGLFMRLLDASYVGVMTDGSIVIPKDVAEVYQSFKGKDFDKERRKINYLISCLNTISRLHGIAPMSVMMQLMKKNPTVQMTEEEIKEAVRNIPPEYNRYKIVKNSIYYEEFYPDDKGLLSVQGNVEFYIPSLDEILKYGSAPVNRNSKEALKLKNFFINKMNSEEEEADYTCGMIELIIAKNGQIQEILQFIEEMGFELPKKREMEKLLGYIYDLWNNTRMLVDRGFTPNELAGQQIGLQEPLNEQNNVIDFMKTKNAKKDKIYPNSPCPCGSGKKYKNCCKK